MSVFFPENNSDSYFSTGTYFSAFALVNDLFYDLVNDLVMTFYDLYDLVNDLIMTFYDLFYLKWLWDEFVLKPGVDISENFPGTRYPSVPKIFFLAGTRYPSVPKIFFLAGTWLKLEGKPFQLTYDRSSEDNFEFFDY